MDTSHMIGTVRDYMISQVETLTPDDSLETAVMLERRFRIRHIPIVESGELVGMVTDHDLKRALPSPVTGSDQQTFERVVQTTRLRQIMTRSPTTISPAAPLRDAVQILCEKKFGALPVVEQGRLVGIITGVDMLRAFLAVLDNA
jgi:acetoin utilization protein AcuB